MTGKTGIFQITGTKGMVAQVSWREDYDPAENTHVLTIDALGIRADLYPGATFYLGGPQNKGVIQAGGVTLVEFLNLAGSHYVVPQAGSFAPVAAAGDYPATPWASRPITGNLDGSCKVSIFVEFYGYDPAGGPGNGFRIRDTLELELTAIPQASTIGATDSAIGAVSMVAVSRKHPDYRHTIAWSFEGLSGWLGEEGNILDEPVLLSGGSIPFALPEAFYEAIPNASSGICTLTCTTWSGSLQIGEPQSCSFRVTVDPQAAGPLVTGTVTDIRPETVALTGDPETLVRYGSQVYCVLTAAPRRGATIISTKIDNQEGDSRVYLQAETGTYTFSATDSRGFTTVLKVTRPLVPYVQLTLHGRLARTDPTSGRAVLTVDRSSWFDGSFGAEANSLKLEYSLDSVNWIPLEPVLSQNGYSAQAALQGLAYDARHRLWLRVSDRLSQVQKILVLEKGLPVFDWGEGDFNFNVPLRLSGVPLLDLLFPIGAVYVTTGAEPGCPLGGSWEALGPVTLGSLTGTAWKRVQNAGFVTADGAAYLVQGATGPEEFIPMEE